MSEAALPRPAALAARATHTFTTGTVERARRTLQVALGIVWLLDAALQYQPYMFGPGLADHIVAPTGSGSPVWVAGPVHWTAQLINHEPAALNALFATVQLLIALGLLTRRTVRPALAASAVWALGLWWLAEGLGGVLAGPVPPAAGLPGAAALYAVLAVLLWPASAGAAGRSVAERSPARTGGTRLLWVALWASFAFEALRPADRAPTALHDLITGNESSQPTWVKTILRWGASGAAHHGTEIAIATAIAFTLIAVFGTAPWGRRPALVLAIVLAALIWIFGEAFGQIATGRATDPNSGPLLALLALTLWPTQLPDRRRDTVAGRHHDHRPRPVNPGEPPEELPVMRARRILGRARLRRAPLLAALGAVALAGTVAACGGGGSAPQAAGTRSTPGTAKTVPHRRPPPIRSRRTCPRRPGRRVSRRAPTRPCCRVRS